MIRPVKLTASLLAITLLAACGNDQAETSKHEEVAPAADENMTATVSDPYLWLEEVEGEKALDWVRSMNAATLPGLEGDPRFAVNQGAALAIYNATDKITYGSRYGDYIHNVWRDDSHVRGLWRKSSVESYASGKPQWEDVLDFDALAKSEDKNWVYKGRNCLGPDYKRCMVRLSIGGTDAVTVREYDLESKSWVVDGFVSPMSKQTLTWLDQDTLMIATDFGDGTMNTSGYARQVRSWKRGTPLMDAELMFESGPDDTFTFPGHSKRDDGDYNYILVGPDFFTQIIHLVTEDGLKQLPLPRAINMQGFIGDRMIIQMRGDWTAGTRTVKSGDLVAVRVADLLAGTPENSLESIFAPAANQALQSVTITKSRIYVSYLQDVTGHIAALVPDEGGWTTKPVEMPGGGTLSVRTASDGSDDIFASYESFLQPETLYHLKKDGSIRAVQALPERFDPSPYVTEQKFATSADGTRVPYFLIRAKDMAYDGKQPTVLYGYGGFEAAATPSYTYPIGNSPNMTSWLQAGGVLAVANIRGGDEYGPSWHQSALKENRQRAFDDFIAIAENLIATKVTSPDKLGAIGRSNGGLLMGAMMTQRPDLFKAIVSGVPLLDMLRYHKLLAGASWTGEYGNPDVAEEAAYISTYSPYQKMGEKDAYPDVLFYTSTKDDRVHPGHARKMAAKMQALGHKVSYYENIEGGHGGASNLKQRAYLDAVQLTYFMQKLMP